MSDFIFKVPELPEDSLPRKRNACNSLRLKQLNMNWQGNEVELSNSSQAILSNRLKSIGYSHLQRTTGNYIKNQIKPSASWDNNFDAHNGGVSFNQVSSGRLGSQIPAEIGMLSSFRSGMNAVGSEYKEKSLFSTSNIGSSSLLTAQPGIGGANLNLCSYNGGRNFVPGFDSQNSFTMKPQTLTLNHVDQINQGIHSKISHIQPLSSIHSSKSVLHNTGLLPLKDRNQRDTSVNDFRNINNKSHTCKSMNKTHISQSDSSFPFNAIQNAIDNQTMMKAVLQTSVVVKEQVINALENFAHSFLMNAPDDKVSRFQSDFDKTVKEVKHIIENNMINTNSVIRTLKMLSTMNYASETLCDPNTGGICYEGQTGGHCKEPYEILNDLKLGPNRSVNCSPKIEFHKSFGVEKKKTVVKSYKSNEVNLKNWYPVVVDGGLAFIGINDDNVRHITVMMRKRINNRKIELVNGLTCNLIGSPCLVKKYPEKISSKIKNGLSSCWKVLLRDILEFDRKSAGKEIVGTKVCKPPGTACASISSALRRKDKSLHQVAEQVKVHKRQLDSAAKLSQSDERVVDLKGQIENRKNVIRKPNQRISGRQNERKNGINYGGQCLDDISNRRDKSINNTVKNNNGDSTEISATFGVTRSGRIVKRPGDLWIGTNFHKNCEGKVEDSCFSVRNKRTVAREEVTAKNEKNKVCQSKRKREAVVDINPNEIKKSKFETSKQKEFPLNTKSSGVSAEKGEVKQRYALRPRLKESEKLCQIPEAPMKNVVGHNERLEIPCLQRKTNRGNEIEEELNDIMIPEISSRSEESISEGKKVKMTEPETPPLKFFRNNLEILNTHSPVESPKWHISRHSLSEVKKFQKIRAEAFKRKLPKECTERVKTPVERVKNNLRNEDLNAVVDWISEREIRTPKQCSRIVKYILPKRIEVEDDEDDEV